MEILPHFHYIPLIWHCLRKQVLLQGHCKEQDQKDMNIEDLVNQSHKRGRVIAFTLLEPRIQELAEIAMKCRSLEVLMQMKKQLG